MICDMPLHSLLLEINTVKQYWSKSLNQWLRGIPVTHTMFCFSCFWTHSFKPFSVMEKNNKGVPCHWMNNWQQGFLADMIHLGYVIHFVLLHMLIPAYTNINTKIHMYLLLDLLNSSTQWNDLINIPLLSRISVCNCAEPNTAVSGETK